jgi:hypothetical protein
VELAAWRLLRLVGRRLEGILPRHRLDSEHGTVAAALRGRPHGPEGPCYQGKAP